TTQTNHAGKTTRLGYDAFDNLATVTAPDGRARRFAYDQLGRLARETDAAGATTRYVYTAAGDLASLTDAKGNRYCFTYDEARRRTAMIYPDGSREKWGYDASGQLVSYTTRARQVKTIAYDGRARPVKVAWSPAGAAPTVTMEYDSGNQLKALDNGIARLTYSYDSIGRILSETTRLAANVANVTPQTVAYAYGSFGQRASLTYPDNTKIGYSYTGQGQLATVSVNGAAPLATYGYAVDGRVASVSRENGVSTRNTYDAIGQLQGIFHRKGSGVLASVEYANPDPSGRRASQTREDGLTERYAFDESGQLVGADYGVNSGAAGKPTRSVDYSYDALGNFQRVTETTGGITSTTDHRANRLNQYTRASEPGGGKLVNFSYDRSGNLTGVDGRGSRSDANHRYNALNQLVATESSGVRTEFYYDAKGRCITRKHYERVSNGRWALSGLASRVLNYDSRSLVTERRLDGSFVANYMHGSRIDEILAMVTPTGTFYPMHDALGSSVALTDRQGAVIERYRYDVFGQPIILGSDYRTRAASVVSFRFLFTGREWLEESKLYDYRSRAYSPSLGRFLQTDSIRFAGGDPNLYRYVQNVPTNLIDPTGEAAVVVIALANHVGLAVVGIAAAGCLLSSSCRSWMGSLGSSTVGSIRDICPARPIAIPMTWPITSSRPKCTFSGVEFVGTGDACIYTCADGQVFRGGGANPSGSNCDAEMDDPRG
ncbi:MAG: RHS repeat protein, partial [Planctomycetes bacterium]|nr:RHS repeat protein [Planctomycetota bacterium]